MAKSSGLSDNFYIGGYDLSGDVTALQSIRVSLGLLDVTAIDKSAMERLAGVADGELSVNVWWDTADDAMHEALSGGLTTDRHAMYARGTTLGNQAACLVGKQIDYNHSRGQDGSLAATVQVLGSSGVALEWGEQLTAGKRTDSAATNGTGLDGTAATAFGLAAYLQVFSFTGTSVTVSLEDSADDISYAAITGASFTAATARTAERITTARTATVRRYVRAVTAGTFSSAVFAVAFKRYPTAE